MSLTKEDQEGIKAQFRRELEELIDVQRGVLEWASKMRAAGITAYKGPCPRVGGLIELELGPLPEAPPITDAPEPKATEPVDPPKRGDDGLTEEERKDFYASSGG